MADFTFVEKRPMNGHEHALDADAIVGREGCEVVLADPEVSRRHAALRKTASGAAVEDLGSTNGTFVNGTRITGLVEISVGDSVRFGNTEWELRALATASAPAGVGSPQVTAARSIPAEPPPAPEPVAAAAPAAAAPAASAPPAAAAITPAAPGDGRRGDVPLPAEVTPSAIRRTLPPEAAKAPPGFTPATPKQSKGSAATRTGYTLFCFIVLVLVIAGLVIYFVTR